MFMRILAPLLLLISAQLFAQTESHSQQFDFDIPEMPRVRALQVLSEQSNKLLLAYLSTDGAEEQALVGPVKGRYTVEQALQILLRSTLLTYRWVEPNMVSVEPGPDPASAAVAADNGAIVSSPHSTDAGAAEPAEREEVTVISWPMRDLTLNVGQVVVMDRERIDAIGAPTVPEALKYLSQSAYTRPEGYRTSGAQYAEMRGLGPDTSLVLINGRRTLPSANSISSSAFDLNTVPITAVERIEFLLDSAAAAYGTDAIGGVINIVLREKVPDPTVEIRYGSAAGGAEQRRATFSGGLERGRFNGALILDYLDFGGLLGAARDRWRDQDYRRYGSADRRSLESSTGNITSASGANLPGLSSPVAAVPLIDTTPATIGIDDFAATAGQANYQSLLEYWSIVPESQRKSVAATGSFELSERVTASAELLYVDRSARFNFYPPSLPGLPVMATNAFNPFGTVVYAHRLLTELGSQSQRIDSELTRGVVSLHGGLGTWDWELSALHSDEGAQTWIENQLDFQSGALPAALASPDRATALNPFQSGPLGSPELLNSLLAPREVTDFASLGTQFAGYVQGPVMQLPAGPLMAVIGGEQRREEVDFNGPIAPPDRDVSAGYLQLRVPLLGGNMTWLRGQELLLTGGGRYDNYSDMGHVLRAQYGLQWRPHRSVTVRASGGRSFRPPSLYELYLPTVSTAMRVFDPARNEFSNVFVTVGGNPELQASKARSLTAGVAFSPEGPLNWRLSADYWRVEMDERVASLPVAQLLANESQFRRRIGRVQNAEDIAADRPGALRTVDVSRVNTGHVEVSGVDVQVRSNIDTVVGRFTPQLLATWFDKYLAVDVPGQPVLDRVNLASELGTILEWRAIASLGWRRGPLGVAAFARYTPSYDDAVAGVRVGRRIDSQTLLDLQGSVELGDLLESSLWRGVRLSAGAVNLLDEEPRFAEIGGVVGYDPSQGDLKQRLLYMQLERKF